MPKRPELWALGLMAFINSTATYGAIQHGTDPTMSVGVVIVCLSLMGLVSIPRKGN